MRRWAKKASFLGVLMLILVASGTTIASAQKRPRSIPARAEFRCEYLGAQGTMVCPATDRIRDDGGDYDFFTPATTEGVSLNSNGELYMNLIPAGAARTMNVDFRDEMGGPVCGTGNCYRDSWPTSAFAISSGFLRTNVVTDSSGETELSGGLLAIPCDGQARPARLLITFSDPFQSVTWSVRFYNAAFPSSDLVSITRYSRTTWTIDAAAGTKAVLIGSKVVKGKLQGTRPEGTFLMPLLIRVTADAPSSGLCQ